MRRVKAEEEDYHQFATAQTLKQIIEAGGLVETGAHGQMQGSVEFHLSCDLVYTLSDFFFKVLGFHWELRMLTQGNLTNHIKLSMRVLLLVPRQLGWTSNWAV